MSKMKHTPKQCTSIAALLAVLASATLPVACTKGNTYAPPPAPQVVVTHPITREVTTYFEYTGHTASVEAVEIRARVQGVLQSMHFKPSTDVKKGDLLFVIEPELYQARAAQAAAHLENARARLDAAAQQLAITQAIFERKAGSKADLVQRTQERDQAQAALAQEQANLAAAQLDLSYTHIYAPISGRIDRNLVDIGNLVGAGEPTLLASIVRQDPIYAYFDVSERDALDYRERVRTGEIAASDGSPKFAAHMALVNEDGFPHVGQIDYMSNKLNTSTGTFEVRAVFPNTDGVLLPGLFVRVRVPVSRGPQLLVPEEAVSSDQGGHFLLLVDANNTVQRRPVETGPSDQGMRIVLDGVTAEDLVIVNGLQRARPGVVVAPVRAEAGSPPVAQPAAGTAKPASS